MMLVSDNIYHILHFLWPNRVNYLNAKYAHLPVKVYAYNNISYEFVLVKWRKALTEDTYMEINTYAATGKMLDIASWNTVFRREMIWKAM